MTSNFVMSVRPSACLSISPFVRTEQLRSYWKNFCEGWYLRIYRNLVEIIQVSLQYGKNTGTLHEDRYVYTFDILPSFS